MSIDVALASQRLIDMLRQHARVRVTDDMRDNARLILQVCEFEGVVMREQVAYVLGTAWHESYLMPTRERRAKPGTEVYNMQNKYWDTGYYGRGFVQLTWRKNYEKFGNLFNVDLVNNPDLALQPDLAAKILVVGMRDGLFTGHKLSHFFRPGRKPLWHSARKIVNGTFHAEEVAKSAKIALLAIA